MSTDAGESGTRGSTAAPEAIHEFWFADALADPAKAAQRMPFWFQSNRDVDEEIAARYAPTLEAAGRELLAAWQARPHACLALILVLDQFPRNMNRGTPAAFQYDRQALEITRRGVAAGHLHALATLEQAFLLMPFQHSEDLACQREGLALFGQMVDAAPPEWRALAEGILRYARLHLEIIERFGRFPHRNRVLGRASTPAEQDYLDSNTESFGQGA